MPRIPATYRYTVRYHHKMKQWKVDGIPKSWHNAKLRAIKQAVDKAHADEDAGKRAIITVQNKDGVVAFIWAYPKHHLRHRNRSA